MEVVSSNVSGFIYAAVMSLPLLLVFLAGMVLSFVFRKRMGKAWIFSAAGFFFLALCGFFSILYTGFIYFMLPGIGYDQNLISQIAMANSIFNFVFSLLGYILLLIAMFIKRPNVI